MTHPSIHSVDALRTGDSQPPEGLVDLMLAARDKHVFVNVTTCACGFQPPMSSDWERHRMEAALAALFEACEVREDFPMTYTTPYAKLPREVVHKVREGAVVGARMYAQEGFTPVKVEHRWTLTYKQPVMRIDDDAEPVSSAGEEKTDGA